jgi:Rrf2 family protein
VESSKNKRIGIKAIAENLKIPAPYTGKILNELVRKGIIYSKKGPTGGFFQTDEGMQQAVLTIIEAIDGLAFFQNCALGLEQCSDDRPCPIHQDFKITKDRFKNILETKTIAQIATEIDNKKLFLVK